MKQRSSAEILRQVKQAIRDGGWAWPGCYPLYVVMADGEAMSISSAKENWKLVCAGTLYQASNPGYRAQQWAAAGVDINYEDPHMVCCHSGERIESAYAEEDI